MGISDTQTENEGRLHTPEIRENFIETIFILQHWRPSSAPERAAGILDFQTSHQYILMAHSPEKQRLMKTTKKQYNVLLHIIGYFKKLLSADEKSERFEAAEQERKKLVPMIVPLTLLSRYFWKYQVAYLIDQWYLYPYPVEV